MSEVARLREQIEAEADALRFLSTGFAQKASHEIITAAYDRLGGYTEQLAQHLGEGEALRITIAAIGVPNTADYPMEMPPTHISIEPLPYPMCEIVEKILDAHGARLEGNDVAIPKGSTASPEWPNVGERYTIRLPDGFCIWIHITEDGRNRLSLDPSALVCPDCKRPL